MAASACRRGGRRLSPGSLSISIYPVGRSLDAHESRQCFVYDPYVLYPLRERLYTIGTFILGAMAYSTFYGNIHQFIQDLYGSSLRYRRRIDEINEFARFHRLPALLRTSIRRQAARLQTRTSTTRCLCGDAGGGWRS